MRQIPLAIGPEPVATFDSYVPGAGKANAAALKHLRTAGAQAGAPIYLWGVSGSGKTHLLRALGQDVQAHGAHMGWFDADVATPWSFDESWALLVLDQCESFDESQQHAAFALYIEAMSRGIQIAASGAVPPVDLPLRDDLRTRLAWGHVFALEALDEADARVVLGREAGRRGVRLSSDVMDYLLTRFSRDLKHLMALLDRLDEFALAEQRAITVPLLKKMFDEEGAML